MLILKKKTEITWKILKPGFVKIISYLLKFKDSDVFDFSIFQKGRLSQLRKLVTSYDQMISHRVEKWK